MKSFSTFSIIAAAGLVPAALTLPHQSEALDSEALEKRQAYGAGPQVIDLDSHVQYGSSMGVIGCKVNTNRQAYFPQEYPPPCDNPCIRLTAPNGNTIHVLHVDSSTGSYDISMDAYKTLKHGPDWRKTNPGTEGKWSGVKWEYVSMDSCMDILPEGKFPVIAKSPDKYVECLKSAPQSFWATHTQFYDIDDARCLRGIDQTCEMPPESLGNIPECANGKKTGQGGNPPMHPSTPVTDVTADGIDEVQQPPDSGVPVPTGPTVPSPTLSPYPSPTLPGTYPPAQPTDGVPTNSPPAQPPYGASSAPPSYTPPAVPAVPAASSNGVPAASPYGAPGAPSTYTPPAAYTSASALPAVPVATSSSTYAAAVGVTSSVVGPYVPGISTMTPHSSGTTWAVPTQPVKKVEPLEQLFSAADAVHAGKSLRGVVGTLSILVALCLPFVF